jgi:zinc metalloprotease ZmpB
MPEHYDSQAGAYVNVDEQGVVRGLVQEEPAPTEAASAREAADQYLRDHSELLGVAPAELENLAATREVAPVAAGSQFRLRSENTQFDTTTVTYEQTMYGLPVWEAGVSVHVKEGPFRVVGADTTRHADLTATRDVPDIEDELTDLERLDERIDDERLAEILGLTTDSNLYERDSLKVQDVTLVVYRYEAAKREPDVDDENTFEHAHPRIPLPPLPDSISEGEHYISAVVNFALGTPQFPTLYWRVIIDLNSGAVLHLRPFVDGVNGLVFALDPMTSAPSGPLPNATASALNAKRVSVTLQGLTAPVSGVQSLRGSIVILADPEAPAIASPTRPSGINFDYDSRTNNFAAVNAYYHSDKFFRLVQSLGFPLAAYFGPTPFPTPTDHRGLGGNTINAHCLGLPGGVGILQTTYALADLADTSNPIGIACDWRVVLHELGGHGVLYPHVHSPNFGFAHSAGDSFAAILNDADSAAADRFVTFPWVNIGRRHDRLPAAGWAWGGVNDVGGYSSEQILATSHFRIYRSIGGDATLPLGYGYRQFAARFMTYLILRTIGTITLATNPANVAGYVNALLTADLGDWTSEGHAGGAYGKVIRWAFEKQGLFQAPGATTPVIAEGKPPPVDVYIEDGRHGEYQFQPVHWACHSIWNRRHADGGTAHESPVAGATNYAYVKIKNRGTQPANNVVVKAFHADPAAGLVYPNDWTPMTTPQLSAPVVAANNAAEIMVGPFEWTPSGAGHQCMFMIVSANGDPSNVSNLAAGETIPEWRLVPHDNNIGQRNVTAVAFTMLEPWLKAIQELRFTLKNPLRGSAKMVLNPTIPRTLANRGWKLEFRNKGGANPKLAVGKSIPISMQLVGGEPFTAADLSKEKNPAIRIEAYANGIIVGGMTYEIAPAERVG